ncbi:hypothetical protein [uncultured Fibrobacter sp.]|uniref:hypothetical protein n=1 Tax=uncultured Fibrobacter sp. TaxID=261512 RepID=UPI0025DB82B8|nr:hypothetical protein [uncultured Fibrobacter sp.]
MSAPNPNTMHPIAGYDKEIYIKPTIKNPNVIVGDFTYIADSEFGSHVTHHYDFIGDGAIIGANSVVGSNVEPYAVVVGNPAETIRYRFDEELTSLLLKFKWWDKPVEEINELIPILTNSDLDKVKAEIHRLMND